MWLREREESKKIIKKVHINKGVEAKLGQTGGDSDGGGDAVDDTKRCSRGQKKKKKKRKYK